MRTLLALSALSLSLLMGGCLPFEDDSCSFANDGQCDDSTYADNFTSACAPGTDFTDCNAICEDTCPTAGDGDCDDGGAGSDFSLCSEGTDCTDCGIR